MSRWSHGRQALIITYLMLIACIIGAVVYFLFIYQAPSCYDGIRNGLEEGVDCGGGCELVCPFAASKPNVAWSRAFEIGPGVYNLAAQVENPNFDVGTNVEYVFRGYDADNILVAEVIDRVTLYPQEKRIIFEPTVETVERRINRLFFEFTTDDGWYQSTPRSERVVVQNYTLDNLETTPALAVDLRNTDIRPVGDLVVTAVLYDSNENVEQLSRTLVERIDAGDTSTAYFSWREPFNQEIEQVEVFVIEPRD